MLPSIMLNLSHSAQVSDLRVTRLFFSPLSETSGNDISLALRVSTAGRMESQVMRLEDLHEDESM